jgi:hypothetical protein
MKIKLSGEQLGKAFADSDSGMQASALNEIGRFMFMSCLGDSNMEKQICYIAYDLDNDGEHFIMQLSEFIKLKKGKE